jgi:hypothetical protein
MKKMVLWGILLISGINIHTYLLSAGSEWLVSIGPFYAYTVGGWVFGLSAISAIYLYKAYSTYKKSKLAVGKK